ncbi:hypothetical protein [Methyloversatilis sp.]|uniref:hypothetical protein n=1 Tax=Methyloversatilis sp. TaxID=2569862 RepID=UPI0035B1A16A
MRIIERLRLGSCEQRIGGVQITACASSIRIVDQMFDHITGDRCGLYALTQNQEVPDEFAEHRRPLRFRDVLTLDGGEKGADYTH